MLVKFDILNCFITIWREANSSKSRHPVRSILPNESEFKIIVRKNKTVNYIEKEEYPSKHDEDVISHWSATKVASQAWTPSLIKAASLEKQ